MSTIYTSPAPQLSTSYALQNHGASRPLLVSGILAALLYLAMNVMAPLQWPAYHVMSQTVSELSAIDAPTRQLWVRLGIVYTVLATLFGWGAWTCTRGNRSLRVAGALLIAFALIGLLWPFAPMHLRGAETTASDTAHIALGIANVLLMLFVVGFGIAGTAGRFRIYSYATLAVMLVSAVFVGVDAPRIAANLPTPLVGFWERVFIAVFLAWNVAIAVVLLRRSVDRPEVSASENEPAFQ